jgi:hypothetical protein
VFRLLTRHTLPIQDDYLRQRVNKVASSYNKNTFWYGDILKKLVFKPDFERILQIVCVFEFISFASIVICLRSHSDG